MTCIREGSGNTSFTLKREMRMKCFGNIVEKIKANKGKTVAITLAAFVLVCAVVTLSCLGAYVFNRIATGVVPTDEQIAAAKGQYKRVLIIGVDGMGDYMNRMEPGSTPNFDKLFGEGFTTAGGTRINASVTHTGMAVYPTISSQNWTSMFHGVRPPYHGITGENSNRDLENGKQANAKYPSFVKQFLDQYPSEKVLSVCTWKAVNTGAIEDLSQVKKINTDCDTVHAVANDELALGDPALVSYIKEQTAMEGYADETYMMSDAITVQRIIDETAVEDYAIAYMHLNQVDSAGHGYGFNKPNYIRAVSRVDVLIGKLFAAYETRGWLDDTLFILCTDHGHRYAQDGTGHGGNSAVERTVTFAIAGKTVKQGAPGKYVNTDLAPIVSYALGVKPADTWQGKVPYDMFIGLK